MTTEIYKKRLAEWKISKEFIDTSKKPWPWRPKGSKSFKDILNLLLEKEMSVKINWQNTILSKKVALIHKLINKALEWDLRSIETIISRMEGTPTQRIEQTNTVEATEENPYGEETKK